MGFDLGGVVGGAEGRLGCEFLPLAGVLPGFEGGGYFQSGEGVAEEGVGVPVFAGVEDGVAFGDVGFRCAGRLLPEDFEAFELLAARVPAAEAELVDF